MLNFYLIVNTLLYLVLFFLRVNFKEEYIKRKVYSDIRIMLLCNLKFGYYEARILFLLTKYVPTSLYIN